MTHSPAAHPAPPTHPSLSAGAAPPTVALADGSGIQIRPLGTHEEFRACVDLQREIWGFEQAEIVPPTLLHVVGFVGGLAVGAFDAGDTLLGFVFGITGVRDGDLVHWSHMLGVRESTRNLGVGRMLKEHQRAMLLALGVKRVYWTFDPLQSKNAYFNVNRLGAVVDEYAVDLYGTTASPLHLGMPTDRLVVRIDTTPRDVPPVRIPTEQGIPILSPFPRAGDVAIDADNGTRADVVLLEIPENIMEVLERSADTARTWRIAVRENFQWAKANDYTVAAVHRNAVSGRAFYVLRR